MALHFVGFKDDRIHAAREIFGEPDFYHRRWDVRALGDIAPGDRVVFANNVCEDLPSHFCWDDSREDIIARGGEKGIDYV